MISRRSLFKGLGGAAALVATKAVGKATPDVPGRPPSGTAYLPSDTFYGVDETYDGALRGALATVEEWRMAYSDTHFLMNKDGTVSVATTGDNK